MGLLTRLTPELRQLKEQGVFRAIAPDMLDMVQGWPVAHQCADEFEAIVSSPMFQAQLAATQWARRYVKVHRNKFVDMRIEPFLQTQGLLAQDHGDQQKHANEWCFVEEKSALLYMSVLAKYLADADMDVMAPGTDIHTTVPGTDRQRYERLIYRTHDPQNSFPCVELHLQKILPVPRQDVPIQAILDFKRQRETELLRYRGIIGKLQNELRQATDQSRTVQALESFKEEQKVAVTDLTAVLEEARIASIWGTVKTLIAAGVAKAGIAAIVPVEFLLPGQIVAGLIAVAGCLVGNENKQRALQRESAFSYVYHARRAKILE
jgi:hypothetical protein